MTKRTLGPVVKEAREGARMTQRDLAAAIGVKASHIAYIENGHRRPSILLINRISATLGLDARELLVLAHPEAKQIVEGDRPSAKKSDGAWPRFVSNKALLRRHAVTQGELKVLKQIAMLEDVAHPGHFVFILNAIRQAAARLRWAIFPLRLGGFRCSIFITRTYPLVARRFSNFSKTLPALRGSHILSGCGHWVQQERPREVNDLLVKFVNGLNQ